MISEGLGGNKRLLVSHLVLHLLSFLYQYLI